MLYLYVFVVTVKFSSKVYWMTKAGSEKSSHI